MPDLANSRRNWQLHRFSGHGAEKRATRQRLSCRRMPTIPVAQMACDVDSKHGDLFNGGSAHAVPQQHPEYSASGWRLRNRSTASHHRDDCRPDDHITSFASLSPRPPASMFVRKPNADTVETDPIRARSRDVVYFASLNGAEVCHIFCTENVTSIMARRRWDRLSSDPLKMNL